MKVLWFTSIMLPEFAEVLGAEQKNINGWLPALVSALRNYQPSLELVIASEGSARTVRSIGGVKYISLGTFRYNRLAGLPSAPFAHAVQACIAEEKPNLVHVHGTEGVFAAMPGWVWGNVKRVVSVQGIILGYCAHYMGGLSEEELARHRFVLRKWLGLTKVSDIARIWREERGGVGERRCFANFRHYLGRTQWDRAWVNYLCPSAVYHEVGEVLRTPFYSNNRHEDSIVPHSIYCSAAVSYPLKGGHWLLRAVAALKSKYGDIRLTIAAGKKILPVRGIFDRLRRGEYDDFLWSEVVRLDLCDNVRLLPSLSDQAVAEELAQSEIFVLPSMIENSPNSLGEAMLSGVPSVATYVGGVPSLLENGKEGLLVPSGDPASLAAAIDRLFSDRDFARNCARNAYETALRRYNPQTVVDQLMSAYGEILEG